jgi:putative membrane protein
MRIAEAACPSIHGELTMMKTTCAIAAACAFLLAGFTAPAAAQQSADKAKAQTSALSKSDQRHFEHLAQSNMAEIQTSKLAQSKASSDEVKQYGERMVEDHGKMLEQQRTMAKAKNVKLPVAPDDKHQAALKRLQGLSGQQFDRAYMEQMVQDHQAALRLVKDIAGKADDPELKAMGEKAVPEIQKHLEMAKQLAADTKSTKSSSK